MPNYEVIEQPGGARPDEVPLTLFGKTLTVATVAERWRIIRHRDFPLISEEETHQFAEQAVTGDTLLMSGCPVDIHPYRLVEIESGLVQYFLDIPQEIRGNRQSYPPVFRFLPALLAIPPGLAVDADLAPENMEMYVMDLEKLLDRSVPAEALLLKTLVTP